MPEPIIGGASGIKKARGFPCQESYPRQEARGGGDKEASLGNLREVSSKLGFFYDEEVI
jgi:hypothetical protein